MKTAVVDRVG